MTKQTLATLKSYFNTGDIPTEADFAEMLESYTPTNANFVVAAVDAPQRVIDYADYVCDGVNDEVQIQAAIDALPATGGKIQFSSGTFTIDKAGDFTSDGRTDPYSILIRNTHGPVMLEGTNGATKISFRAGAAALTLFMVFIRGTAAARRTNPTTIVNIEFLGNDLVGECVDSKFAEKNFVDHCKFSGGGGFNIASLHFSWNSGKSVVTNNYFSGGRNLCLEGNNYTVSNNIFVGVGADENQPMLWLAPDLDLMWETPLYFSMYTSTVTGNIFIGGGLQLCMGCTHGCTIVGNTFSFQEGQHQPCLLLEGILDPVAPFDAIGNVISSNTFTDFYWGITLKGSTDISGSVGAIGNIIAQNTFNRKKDGTAYNYAIWEQGGTCDHNLIINNHFDPAGVAIIQTIGANTVVSGNDGYKTEAQGAAAAVADGGTIAHGCVVAPTVVTVSGSVAGEIVTVTSIGATHITVGIKKNDGSAGTAQTVYWRAEV